ncbi:MAG TPA: metallophosphoesterase [Terriglobia bacterium]|nr:metallophosphoesterase [Terriglobia bacterium]
MPSGKLRGRAGSTRWLVATVICLMLILFLLGSNIWAAKSTTGGVAQNSLVESPGATWTFAVSGDSRNCGDVVMPAIAAGAREHHAAFYWHLGDFRWGSDIDQDMANEAGLRHPISISRYEDNDWADFIQNQLLPFGPTPVFLAIGNHELHFKTEKDYVIEFANWLNTPIIQRQRLEDNATAYGPQTYYHWRIGGVDFITLDNAADDQFTKKQLRWFESVLKSDESDPNVHTIVLGMHKALPHSLAQHSMDESDMGIESGTRAYKDLLKARQEGHKHLYILCAHLHLYMANIFNTDYWKSHGGVLPGWIVATAGATRAKLPADSAEASAAITDVYGYLLGTVNPPGGPEGVITFKYYEVKRANVPASVVDKFTPELVNWCFEENRKGGSPWPAGK